MNIMQLGKNKYKCYNKNLKERSMFFKNWGGGLICKIPKQLIQHKKNQTT